MIVMLGACRAALHLQKFWKMIIDGVVELQQALVGELDHGDRGEELGDRSQIENRAVAPVILVFIVGVAVAVAVVGLAFLHDFAAKPQEGLEIGIDQKCRDRVGDGTLGSCCPWLQEQCEGEGESECESEGGEVGK
jgi:hypothetical protein